MIKKALLKSLLSILVIFSMLMVTFCSFDIYEAAEFVSYPSDSISIKYATSKNGSSYRDGNTVSILDEYGETWYSRLIFSLDKGTIFGNSEISFSFTYKFNKSHDHFRINYIYFFDSDFKVVSQLSGYSSLINIETIDELYVDVSLSSVSLGSDRTRSVKYIQVMVEQGGTPYPCTISVEDLVVDYYTPSAVDDMVTPTPEDQDKVDSSNSEMEENSSQMDSMIDDMNSMDKPDSDDLINNIDTYIPLDDIDVFSAVLSTLFENEIVISYLMIVLVVALVSFVLFGKKG